MHQLDDAQVFLPDVWASHADYYPDKEAVVCGPDHLSYGELDRRLNRVANALLAQGIGRGDRVAVLMANSVAALCCLLGVVKAGASVVPLSGLLLPEQLAVLINDSGAVAVVADADSQPRLDAVRSDLGTVAADRFFVHGGEAPGWRGFETLLAEASAARPAVRYEMTDEYNIIYSSGTTGLPKGIIQTHRVRQHWSYFSAIELGFSVDSRALATTPLYSNGTLLMVLPALFVGATLVIMPEFSAGGFLDTVAREAVTHTFMVPPQFLAILAAPEFDKSRLRTLRMVLSGGSPLRRETKQRVLADFSAGLFEIYGFSEGMATLIRPHQHADKAGSVGTPALGYEIRILDEDGNSLPRGEVGEIAGHGGGQMAGYLNRPKETEKIIWRDERGRVFLRSGDIGKLDEDGFLYILDRKKDMIISGGFNVFPADIEEVVAGHADVADVTVIGVPHERWGESPLALVIPDENRDPDAGQIRDWTNQRVAKHQRLAGVEFRAEFPRNALGKVLKRQLREPYWRE